MKKLYITLTLIAFITSLSIAQKVIKHPAFKDRILDKTIIVKLKPEHRNLLSTKQLSNILNKINTSNIAPMFKNATPPPKGNKNMVDLSLIYQINYNSDIDIAKAIKLFNIKEIEYSQAYYIPELLYNPNDPNQSSQYYLNSIKAYEAWDINKGDTNVVIGITDTGIDIDHPDLVHNIKYNFNDPIDGIDNDGDSYIDNFRGWDVGNNDNNPQVEDNNQVSEYTVNHGVYVAGLASASTDNGVGIAGPGFKCKILPIKISDSNISLTGSYQGIVYAANHGCDIINCSWGGHGGHPFGQDIINYATFNRNALVVAAAGNNGNDELFYPASYENVISVGGTNENDLLQGSNYGTMLDVCAPGTNTYTTNQGGGYIQLWSGTSFASPIAAGAAGIIKSQYPDFTALQIGEALKVSADKIDTIADNMPYYEMIGSGRVNLFKALSQPLGPAVNFSDIHIFDNNDEVIEGGESFYINGNFVNLLEQGQGLTANFVSLNDYATVASGLVNIGTMNTFDSLEISGQNIVVNIDENTPNDEEIIIKIIITGNNNYRNIQYFRTLVNPSFLDLNVNKITCTLAANGRLGHSDRQRNNGSGFMLENAGELMYDAGLIMATDANNVSSSVRQDNDFVPFSASEYLTNNLDTQIIVNSFTDTVSGDALNLKVLTIATAINSEGFNKSVIVEYKIINQGNENISQFYCGLFADWDIDNAGHNKSNYDATRRMIYSYDDQSTGIHTAIKLLSGTSALPYAIDQIPGGDGLVDITGEFSDQEKFFVISNTREEAGNTNEQGNDVANTLSINPQAINSLDTLTITYGIIAGENLFTINTQADSLQNYFNRNNAANIISLKQSKFTVYPNPAKNTITISSAIDKLEITDITGRIVLMQNNIAPNNQIDIQKLSPGNYLIKAYKAEDIHIIKFVKH